MPMWDKAALLKDRRAFIEHLQWLDSEGCLWLLVPLAEDESSRFIQVQVRGGGSRRGTHLFSRDAHRI